MKKIEVIIKPEKLSLVKDALKANGIAGMAVSEVRGFGNQGGRREIFRGIEYVVDTIPKAKIEIVTEEKNVDFIIEIIRKAVKDDAEIGGGKIFVYPIEQVIRLRTNERGKDAI